MPRTKVGAAPKLLHHKGRGTGPRHDGRLSVASIWRWTTKGIKGGRLATIALGRFRRRRVACLRSGLRSPSDTPCRLFSNSLMSPGTKTGEGSR